MRYIYLFIAMIFTALLSEIRAESPAGRLPEQFGTYKMSGKMDYDSNSLFEYINGGAELYLSYGLVGMSGCKYVSGDESEISVEIYEMTGSQGAYGVFTQGRYSEEYDYGQGSQSIDDFIFFWKDRYFVVITTPKLTPQSAGGIKQLALLADKAIPDTGKIPDIVKLLPQDGLQAAGFLYFKHYIWLNSYYFIADYNITDLNDQTDAVLAKYGTADNRCYLLITAYPDTATANKAYLQLKQKFVPETGTNFSRIEDGTWVAVWIKDNKLGAVFNGNSRETTERLYRKSIINM
jgi:hypothetical protein